MPKEKFECVKKSIKNKGVGTIGKLLLLTLDDHEETVIDKIIAAISDCISLEAMQTIPVPALRTRTDF